MTPPSVVLTAAADALPITAGDRRAYPLVLAGMVTAVLEVDTPIVDEDTEQVLSSLLSTAAAALESAHLHSTAREQAEMDGLTQLPNRRRFEHDIDTEWERCRRYGRPMVSCRSSIGTRTVSCRRRRRRTVTAPDAPRSRR